MTGCSARCVFGGFFTSDFFLSCLGRDGKRDVVTGLTCAPVFETLRSLATVLPSSSTTVISTSITGDGGGFLINFIGDFATCLDATLIDTAGSLGASGRRTDAGPPVGFDVTFFFVVDFLTTGGTAFGLTGEGSGEVSDTGSSSTATVTRGEAVIFPLVVALLKPSLTTILWERFPYAATRFVLDPNISAPETEKLARIRHVYAQRLKDVTARRLRVVSSDRTSVTW